MRFTQFALTALTLLSELELVATKAVTVSSWTLDRKHQYLHAKSNNVFETRESQIERRSAQADTNTLSVTSNGITNATIASACLDAVSEITSVGNLAGWTACYNILQFNLERHEFFADLRVYQSARPAGEFENVTTKDISINYIFPESTSIQPLVKRNVNTIMSRQSGLIELKQWSMIGAIANNVDLSKLNSTQILSLMAPTLSLSARGADSQSTIKTNLSISDTAWFVVGEFQNEPKEASVSSIMAESAILSASEFVLPGTTFGIFPTSLLVTSTWMVLFVLAYGIGTLGRIRSRALYRKRKAASLGLKPFTLKASR